MFLFRLGGKIARHRGLTVAIWFLVLFALIGGSRTLGSDYDDTFVVPGSSAQEGQDVLADRFGLTGTNGQVLVTADTGTITDQQNARQVADLASAIDDLDGVAASNPLQGDNPLVSDDKKHTIINVRFASQNPDEDVLDEVTDAARPSRGSDLTTSVGGDAYKPEANESHVPELLGLLVSYLILALTFGSLLAAGMPIFNSLVGVGVTLSTIVLITNAATVSSSAPTLAEMLGLAVGIDYALFILSRHRRYMAEGHSPEESVSRALATAGSAVVFAGATVIIALTGLTVADIPVLTVMGLAAAGAVAIAVLVALTLLPAVALLLGERLRPKQRKQRQPRRKSRKGDQKERPPKVGFGTRWVHAVTKVPALTIAAVLVLVGIAAIPGTRLDLALPDNSTAPDDSEARQTYDGITAAFGEGYNSPLTVTADIITSTDPTKTVDDLAKKVSEVPDVVAILQSTPNPEADTALVALAPREGQMAESTADLVQELRDRAPDWEQELGIDNVLVAGTTAVNIDVSARLASALLPFAGIVIGLSVLLLTIVFRSIAVPIKATFGYLLSVGAALGAVVAAFQWGWLDPLLGVAAGPVVSFLPIFVMGVLFGLAMDYEMFLVSAIREEYVLTGDPREAIYRGFKASAVVVTAAAAIMTSVFIAFIPGGSATIQPIAFGLAVGVAVDAYIVRMTLVPAVLMLLGHRAWWLPSALDRALPEVDVEGAALHRKVGYERWAADAGPTALYARQLRVTDDAPPLDVVAPVGTVTRVVVPDGVDERVLAHVLAGRASGAEGELVVAGLLLPEQRELVNRAATVIDLGDMAGDDELAVRVRTTTRLAGGSRKVRRERLDRTLALVDELERAIGPGSQQTLRAAVVAAAEAVATGVTTVVISGLDRLLLAEDRSRSERLADDLAARGLGVVLLLTRTEAGTRQAPPAGVPASTTELVDALSTGTTPPAPDADPPRRPARPVDGGSPEETRVAHD